MVIAQRVSRAAGVCSTKVGKAAAALAAPALLADPAEGWEAPADSAGRVRWGDCESCAIRMGPTVPGAQCDVEGCTAIACTECHEDLEVSWWCAGHKARR